MTLDPKSLTFHEAHQALLRELDESWSDLRATYAQLAFCSPNDQDYQDIRTRFKATQEALWRLKEAFRDVS